MTSPLPVPLAPDAGACTAIVTTDGSTSSATWTALHELPAGAAEASESSAACTTAPPIAPAAIRTAHPPTISHTTVRRRGQRRGGLGTDGPSSGPGPRGVTDGVDTP